MACGGAKENDYSSPTLKPSLSFRGWAAEKD